MLLHSKLINVGQPFVWNKNLNGNPGGRLNKGVGVMLLVLLLFY